MLVTFELCADHLWSRKLSVKWSQGAFIVFLVKVLNTALKL